ncbi:hypothetical protein [Streptomyces goshikiensis]|uniref:hypothetical protein n=1 Tax=Streptomyces goshikiensis TaxID=1942 RepID=UPI0036855870
MIRTDQFLISQRPYAVDLSSLDGTLRDTPQGDHPHYFHGQVNAVWFRRRHGITVACIGMLWDHQPDQPADAHAFLKRHDDGRYGGDCKGRWDGTSYWGNGTYEQQQEHLAILRPMLASFPAVPQGYDGWWRFA